MGLSCAKLSPENKLSRVGGGGWLEKLVIRLSQLPTKLKLKLKLSLAIKSHKIQKLIYLPKLRALIVFVKGGLKRPPHT